MAVSKWLSGGKVVGKDGRFEKHVRSAFQEQNIIPNIALEADDGTQYPIQDTPGGRNALQWIGEKNVSYTLNDETYTVVSVINQREF